MGCNKVNVLLEIKNFKFTLNDHYLMLLIGEFHGSDTGEYGQCPRVSMDMTITDIARGRFFRVCVELDLSRPLIPRLMIMGRVVQVEYEGLPKICFHCGLYGHRIDLWPKMAPPPTPTSTVTSDQHTPHRRTRGNMSPQAPMDPK